MFTRVAIAILVSAAFVFVGAGAEALPTDSGSTSSGGSANGSTATLWAQYQQQVSQTRAPAVTTSSTTSAAQKVWWAAIWEKLFAAPTCASYGTCVPVASPIAASRTISLSDIASFAAQSPGLTAEPANWTIRGLATNFIASTDTHVVGGRLLGRNAEVRFTPASMRLDFGDGQSISTSDFGRTWAAQGLGEFSDTVTSHRYATIGSVSVVTTVMFTVEYRYGTQSWNSIAGAVSAQSNRVPLRIFEASSALVQHSCAERTAAGC